MSIVTIVAIAIVVPLTIRFLVSQRGAVRDGDLAYSTAHKALALGLACAPSVLFATIVALQTRPLRPDEHWAVAALIGLFPLIASPLIIEFFLVRHTFDDERLRFRTPYRPRREVRWSDVRHVTWRPILKWLDLRDEAGRVFHISPLLSGLERFGEVALAHIPPGVLASSTAGHATLRLMAAGAAAPLLLSPLAPEQLAAELVADRRRDR